MHKYQKTAKEFLVGHVVEMRREKVLKKSVMSVWLQIGLRSYFEIEKGKYGLSTAALLCFLCGRKDPEGLDLVRQFRKKVMLPDQVR